MKWLIILFVLLNLIEAHAAIYDDGQDTHGGSPIIAEVMNIRDDLYIHVQDIPDFVLSRYPGFKDKFSDAVVKAELRLEGELYWKGQRVLAINHPKASPPIIQINSPYWIQSREDINLRKVVLHEYLFIAGWDDSTYIHSDLLMEMINIAGAPNPWYFIEFGIKNRSLSFASLELAKSWLEEGRFEYQEFAVVSLFKLTTSLGLIEDNRVKLGLFGSLLDMVPPKHYCSVHMSGVISELKRADGNGLARDLLRLMGKKFKVDLSTNSPAQCR